MLEINEKMEFFIISDDDNYARKLLPDIPVLPGNMETDFLALFKTDLKSNVKNV